MVLLVVGHVKYWILSHLFSPLVTLPSTGTGCNVYPRVDENTGASGLAEPQLASITARPNRSACSSATCSVPLPLCMQRHYCFEMKQHAKPPHFPQWLSLCNLLSQLINALRSGPADYRISSLFCSHIPARVCVCVRLINPNRAFFFFFPFASCRFQGWLLSQKSLYVSLGGVGATVPFSVLNKWIWRRTMWVGFYGKKGYLLCAVSR